MTTNLRSEIFTFLDPKISGPTKATISHKKLSLKNFLRGF